MDLLDILEGRYHTTHTGRYFERLPVPMSYPVTVEQLYEYDEGKDFDYRIVNPEERRYKMLLNNLSEPDGATATVSTREDLDWGNKAYVLLDDGTLYTVISITKDLESTEDEASRLMTIPVGTEYILRLVEKENPWEIT